VTEYWRYEPDGSIYAVVMSSSGPVGFLGPLDDDQIGNMDEEDVIDKTDPDDLDWALSVSERFSPMDSPPAES
jgi:hypothetical protein